MEKHVLVIGTGVIGEPLARLLGRHAKKLGIQVWCLKHTPRPNDVPMLLQMKEDGVSLAVRQEQHGDFVRIGLRNLTTLGEIANYIDVVIDCSPDASKNTELHALFGDACIIGQGGSKNFGDVMYVGGVNRVALNHGVKHIKIGSCGTNAGVTIAREMLLLCDRHCLAHLSILRRTSDIGQRAMIASTEPKVSSHHANDIMKVLDTAIKLEMTSMVVEIGEQYMHTTMACFDLDRRTTVDEVSEVLKSSRAAFTSKASAGEVFSFGMINGPFGRLLMPAVVVEPTIQIAREGKRIMLTYFVPQMGNVLWPSMEVVLWAIHGSWERVDSMLDSVLAPYMFKRV